MLGCLIRSKESVPHEVSREEFAHPPMLVEALFQMVAFIHRISNQPHDRLSRRAFEASRELHELGFGNSWYSLMVSWLLANGLDINNLPPLKYNHDAYTSLISHEERNKVIRQEIWQTYIRHKWIHPLEPLSSTL